MDDKDMTRRRFLAASLSAGGSSLTLANGEGELSPTDLRPAAPIGMAAPSGKVTQGDVSRLVIDDPAAIKILQFTDVHFFCDREKYGEKRDRQTIEDLSRIVEHVDPDIIAFTGDVWHDLPKGGGTEFFDKAIKVMPSFAKPWLFTWGNHDLLDDYGPAQVALSHAPNSLYKGGYSGGNYTIRLLDREDKPLWDLLCLNTTTQGIQEPQETWLRQLLSARSKEEKLDNLGISLNKTDCCKYINCIHRVHPYLSESVGN